MFRSLPEDVGGSYLNSCLPFKMRGLIAWENDARLGVAGPMPQGDMGIVVPAQFVSTNDLVPTRNALATMFAAINPTTGALPESGPPLSQQGSDTYHAWTLIGVCQFFLGVILHLSRLM